MSNVRETAQAVVDKVPEAAPAPATPTAPRVIEAPQLSWMRGGTMTAAYEKQLRVQKEQAKKDRELEDTKRIAAERNPTEAKQKVHSVGGNRRHPGVVLELRNRDNKVLDYIECELHVLPDETLMLQMACPWCYARAGITDNFHIRQKHRHFELDTRKQGELWVNPDNPSHVVHLAGTIQLTEPVTCPNLGCGKRFVIENSVIREK